MITAREFLTDDVYLDWLARYERMRQFRNLVSERVPTECERMKLKMNKPWESFYKIVLSAGNNT